MDLRIRRTSDKKRDIFICRHKWAHYESTCLFDVVDEPSVPTCVSIECEERIVRPPENHFSVRFASQKIDEKGSNKILLVRIENQKTVFIHSTCNKTNCSILSKQKKVITFYSMKINKEDKNCQ